MNWKLEEHVQKETWKFTLFSEENIISIEFRKK